jgi:hypothetical protein
MILMCGWPGGGSAAGNSSEAANRRLARTLLALSTNTALQSVGRISLRLSQAEPGLVDRGFHGNCGAGFAGLA